MTRVTVLYFASLRDAAFAACRFIIDEVKACVPIWKHEGHVEGEPRRLHPRPGEPPSRM